MKAIAALGADHAEAIPELLRLADLEVRQRQSSMMALALRSSQLSSRKEARPSLKNVRPRSSMSKDGLSCPRA
jgi:hypothetical protein